MSNVRVLRQVEVEPPRAFAEATPPALFERLRMTPVPVLFQRQQQGPKGSFRWTGFCSAADLTEAGEVVIDSRLAETSVWEPRDDQIQVVYLHEVAHRLMPGFWHNAAFAAMVWVLYLRAGVTNELPMWQRSALYDIHDEAETPENLPRAFAWAWKIAHELAPTDHTAERCAEIITERYKEWQAWLSGEADRQQARRDAADAARAATQALENKIKSLKENRWLWALAGATIGAFGMLRLMW